MTQKQIVIIGGIIIGVLILSKMYADNIKYNRLMMANKQELEDPKPKDLPLDTGKNANN